MVTNLFNMSEVKKYRLGNQSEEYELITKYLGWIPEGFTSWYKWHWAEQKRRLKSSFKPGPAPEVTIVSPDQSQKIILLMHQQIIKDAFPLNFFGEERAKDWHQFCIVSEKETPKEQFIIPLH